MAYVSGIMTGIAALISALGGLFSGIVIGKKQAQKLVVKDERTRKNRGAR